MAIQFLKLFQPVQLGTSAASVFSVPLAPATSLLSNGQVQLTNTSGSPVAVTLYAVPSGNSPSNTNTILPSVSVSTIPYVLNLPQMASGDALYGFAGSGSSIAITPMAGVIQS